MADVDYRVKVKKVGQKGSPIHLKPKRWYLAPIRAPILC